MAIVWRLIARVPRVRRRGVAALARRRPTSSPARPGSSSRRSDRGAQTNCSEMRPQAALRGLAVGGRSLRCFGSHCIRHATATLLVNNGMPLEEVSRYLGHSSTVPTRRYAQQTPEALGERARASRARGELNAAAPDGLPCAAPDRYRTGRHYDLSARPREAAPHLADAEALGEITRCRQLARPHPADQAHPQDHWVRQLVPSSEIASVIAPDDQPTWP